MLATLIKKISTKIRNRLNKYLVQRRVNNAKYVHIMFNDKFNKPFVDFLNKNFNNTEHLVLCKKFHKKFCMPTGNNVIEIREIQNINFKNAKRIICHSLFDSEIIDILYKNTYYLSKALWIVWGGDLYEAPRDVKNDTVRNNVKGYLGDIDEEYIVQNYRPKGKFWRFFYVFPITSEMLSNTTEHNRKSIRIQINNSCDQSTLEILDILSRFKNENIIITTVLSYGNMEYREEIVRKGQEIFHEKFIPLYDFLPPAQYAQHLSENDLLILNQPRQQGFGNTLASLFLGKKIFIKNSTTTYSYLRKNGFLIYDTETIGETSFRELCCNMYQMKNTQLAKRYFDVNYLASLFKEAL